MTTSGFVAGTLVHTDKGLVPIEQLKVGDMVLSKHESGEGEQAYKRVVKTFKSAEKM
ncbi:MAG: Hint domain-containing protein [Moraxellaceae bacterium]|nr:Hint domain-containing protein [Moraxellaceae bacterium]